MSRWRLTSEWWRKLLKRWKSLCLIPICCVGLTSCKTEQKPFAFECNEPPYFWTAFTDGTVKMYYEGCEVDMENDTSKPIKLILEFKGDTLAAAYTVKIQ